MQSTDSDSNIKIADFGFAKRCPKSNCLTTQCGTPGYVAPEILEGTPYDMKADMWSLGVIVYILLGGYPPFIEQNQRELFRKIRKGQYEFHEGKKKGTPCWTGFVVDRPHAPAG
jgi:calcium/calmodulin-dependent protein kinase I